MIKLISEQRRQAIKVAPTLDERHTQDQGSVLKYFLYLFVPILVLVVLGASGVFFFKVQETRDGVQARETAKIRLTELGAHDSLRTAMRDLLYLTQDDDLRAYVRNPSPDTLLHLQHRYLNYVEAKEVYDQIRYIDVSGKERVRVNLIDHSAVVVAQDALQDKRHRYYFKDAINLPEGSAFMSRLDLNIEHNRIELPYKPVIRLAAPIYEQGHPVGVVVLNYLAEDFLNEVRHSFSLGDSQGFLLNARGDWLIGPSRDVEWAFMSGRSERFQDAYPHAWNATSHHVQNIQTDRGFFTMRTIYPPQGVVLSDNSDPYWFIVSRVDEVNWYVSEAVASVPEILVLLVILLVLAAMTWRVAVSWSQRDQMDVLYNRSLVDALTESEHRNTAVIEASDDAIMTCTEQGTIRHVNPAAETMFKLEQADLEGRDITEFLMDPAGISVRLPDGEIQLQERSRFETYAVRGSGEGFPAEINVTPINSERGTRFSLFIRDITLRRSFEERLKRLANYDPLTGLANRVLLLEHLNQALDDNEGDDGPYAVIMGDLDDFRIVNDTLGHGVGDEALKEVAERIHKIAPSGSLSSRFGGDEFVIVLPCKGDRALPGLVCDAILNVFDQPLEVSGHRLYVGISLGVAFADGKDDTAAGLLQMADAAMYAAKGAGRNTYRIFTLDMQEESARFLAIQTRLAGAKERDDIALYFQPLVDAKSQRIIGAEALLRWTDAELGAIGPAEFVPVAESTGLIIEFGEWVLDVACRHAKAWRDHIPDFHVAVNISPVQLIGSDVVSTVKTALLKNALDPSALEVEITEGLLIKDPKEAETTLNNLAEIGVRISIDDFGTGYSSLSYLHRYPFSTLKVDRMFVMGLPDDEDSKSLVTTVLALAARSNLKVIAEGVETTGQSQWLSEQGCDILQGYLYGKPMPLEAFTALVENRDPNVAGEDHGPTLKLV